MVAAVLLVIVLSVRRTREDHGRADGLPLPVLGSAPDFSLTERNNRLVTGEDLRGRVWIADFIFTRCAGPCPELTLRMRSLQQSLRGRGANVRLVSFTLDPEYDTPAVLRRYAKRYHADPDIWWFLTGVDQASIHRLVEKGFLQTVAAAKGDDPIVHSTYFVLVDRAGRIRGFYPGLDPQSKPRILADVEALLREP